MAKKAKRLPGYDGKTKWKDEYYVKAYLLARQGEKDARIARIIGVEVSTWQRWIKSKPALAKAVKQGRRDKTQTFQASFRSYVFKRLAPELKDLWEEINECENESTSLARVEALLDKKGKRARQHLFLYALVDSNFNKSEACRKVNISLDTLRTWIHSEPEFCALIDQMHEHKGDLFEQGLIDLVLQRDPSATIFANKTYNRDRGYNDKVEIVHSGQVNHSHTMIDIESLDLSLEVRTAVLEAVRKKRELEGGGGQLALPAPDVSETETEDAEFEEVY